ncbi:DUF2254 domain-containing protein [Actomonas aquatica]|uniref:DUF2254 domain-containing protein n=1 Tax=Actomonas aquatica TaxID=2866162 RepID=A0ABZ1C4V3_9BACT|nr:DUF2254 domain-containing protein [Opitutus sp. WL0086]WRQ86759.1 DUF2254 domain-containing protein [Opitutus sp. WL0086]
MRTRWHNLLERLRATLWVLPALLACGAAALAEIAIWVDDHFGSALENLPVLYPGGIEGGRQVLTTLAGSMVSLTTISFSVMMVVLTLASNQFGPRVLRNFTADRFYQIVLGVFVSTFAYCLLVLGHLSADESTGAPVPRLTISLALVLALGSLATLIAFIHHVARSVQASYIVLRAHHETCRTIAAMFPEELGDEPPSDVDDRVADYADREPHFTIHADRAGYVQALNVEDLLEFAAAHDLVIELTVKPGQFITRDTELARLHGDSLPNDLDEKQLCATGRSWVLLGAERTGEQDCQYGVRQLTEIGVRCLSPGINDPVTAVACIDYLTENLISLARRAFPSRCRVDEDNQLRAIVRRDDFADIADAAFDNLRHYGREHPEVACRLADSLRILAPHLRRPADRAWAERTLAALRLEIDQLTAERDRQAFATACDQAHAALA